MSLGKEPIFVSMSYEKMFWVQSRQLGRCSIYYDDIGSITYLWTGVEWVLVKPLHSVRASWNGLYFPFKVKCLQALLAKLYVVLVILVALAKRYWRCQL